mmetsp:Transcript_9658/g.28353  ORF Transcript_9658/g.28353 Transcript_9658/m.28353 type:complete len:221 (+) Transcript_9658:580-1242(+)
MVRVGVYLGAERVVEHGGEHGRTHRVAHAAGRQAAEPERRPELRRHRRRGELRVRLHQRAGRLPQPRPEIRLSQGVRRRRGHLARRGGAARQRRKVQVRGVGLGVGLEAAAPCGAGERVAARRVLVEERVQPVVGNDGARAGAGGGVTADALEREARDARGRGVVPEQQAREVLQGVRLGHDRHLRPLRVGLAALELHGDAALRVLETRAVQGLTDRAEP